jgi:hypothetical protein
MRGVCAVNQTVAGWGKLLLMDLRLPYSNREIFSAKVLRLAIQGVVSSLTQRPLNETQRKCSQSWLKARAGVSSTHLNKQSLINSLAAHIDETCPCRADTQAVLPPKISPVLPGSQVALRLGRQVAPAASPRLAAFRRDDRDRPLILGTPYKPRHE